MDEVPPIHQIRTPEGCEGWQWENSAPFSYDKDDMCDRAAARRAAQDWATAWTEIRRLKEVAQQRLDAAIHRQLVQNDEPIILNFEAAKAVREAQ